MVIPLDGTEEEIAEAYAVLSDDEKRQLYDRFGKRGMGVSPGGFDQEIFADFNDVLGDRTFSDEISRRYGSSIVLITRGADGCAVYHDGQFDTCPGTTVEVSDTVGSGDAFTRRLVLTGRSRGVKENVLQRSNTIGRDIDPALELFLAGDFLLFGEQFLVVLLERLLKLAIQRGAALPGGARFAGR